MLPQASGIEATDLDGGGFSSDDGASAANDQDGGGFSSDGEKEVVVGPSQHSPARSRSRSREVARVLFDSAPVSRAPELPAPVVRQIDVHTVPPLIPPVPHIRTSTTITVTRIHTQHGHSPFPFPPVVPFTNLPPPETCTH